VAANKLSDPNRILVGQTLSIPSVQQADTTPTAKSTIRDTPIRNASAVPSQTPRLTATATPEATPSPTTTARPTASPTVKSQTTATPVPSRTPSPTAAVTHTPEPTSTSVPTKTASLPPTATRTPRPTLTPVTTKTFTAIPSPSRTPRPTATPALTAPATATASANRTGLPAETSQPTRTVAATLEASRFGYGFQIAPARGDISSAVQAVRDAGFGWIKLEVSWADIEPDHKGALSWAQLDGIIAESSAAGLKVLVNVSDAPAWARSPYSDRTVVGPPLNPQDLADFMAGLAEHYRGQVQAIEVWNSQNLAYQWGYEELDPERYVKLLCAVYKAVKAVDPTIAVISGGLMPTGVTAEGISIDDLEYLRQMYAVNCKDCLDGVGVHPLGYNNPPDATLAYSNPSEPTFKVHRSFYFRETMEAYRELLIRNGDSTRLLWPTEFGWASATRLVPGYEYAADVTAYEQAQYLVKACQMMKTWGWVGPAFVWNLDYNVVEPGSDYALYSVWGRLAYDSLKAMPK